MTQCKERAGLFHLLVLHACEAYFDATHSFLTVDTVWLHIENVW